LERLEELLEIADPAARRGGVDVTLALGALHGGFAMKGLTVLTDHEIFRRARRIRRPRRYRQSTTAGAAGSLAAGDYVVGDRLNVPLYRLDQIEPYRAAPDADSPPPRLDALGSTRWRKQRAATERAIREMA